MPSNLAARYEEARSSPRLLSLSDDIALAEARLAELLEAVGVGESRACWQELRARWEAFEEALATGDMAAMQGQFERMKGLVVEGERASGVWDEIQAVWAARGKLVQTEMKTLQGMQQMVTTQQLMLVLGAMTAAVTQAVQTHASTGVGRRILMDVQAEFTRLSTIEER